MTTSGCLPAGRRRAARSEGAGRAARATTPDDPSGTPRSAPCAAAASLWAPGRAPDSRRSQMGGHPRVLRGGSSCIAASRGVTSLRPVPPAWAPLVWPRPRGHRRCAASRRASGGWARRPRRPGRPLRRATRRRAAAPSCPRADRSTGDEGCVANPLAAVHPVLFPILRFERASDGLVRSPRVRPQAHSGPRPPAGQALGAAFASRAGQLFGRSW